MKDWYKAMAFYQIWIRSFYDGNNDGIGDLYGVYEKLEYIKSLGVDGILTVGMGMPPLMRFTQGGVIVYSERETPLVGDVAIRFAQGQVDRMSPEDACSHH